MLARQAIELHSQVCGSENGDVSNDMATLAEVLDFFNDVDDDEVPRLMQQSIAIHRRMEGNSFVNVAVGEQMLGCVYGNIAERARTANDLERCVANYKLAVPHFRESARIHNANNQMDRADESLHFVARAEDNIRQVGVAIAAAAAAARG